MELNMIEDGPFEDCDCEVAQTMLLGEVIWGTFNRKTFWPGIVVSETLCGSVATKTGCAWVYWFGDHRVSEVPWGLICNFRENYPKYAPKCRARKIVKAVIEAIQYVAYKYGYAEAACWPSVRCLGWAQNNFVPIHDCLRISWCIIGPQVQDKLQRIREIRRIESQRSGIKKFTKKQIEVRKAIKERRVNLDAQICIGCYKPHADAQKHPLFHGHFCGDCLESLRAIWYAFGTDGANYFCTICTRSGTMYVCGEQSCGRVFCRLCIDIFCEPGAEKVIKREEPWSCFLCSGFNPYINGILKKRSNWERNIYSLFDLSNNMQAERGKLNDLASNKRPVRVLSLFDGIGAGRVALRKLGIQVEVYFCSEIDENGMNVVRSNFGPEIRQIGDVTQITKDVIKNICPINLLLGGSPCNDLSVVNPLRKGLYDESGTGVLFFEFVRIMKLIEEYNGGTPLLWLFENVCTMPGEYKQIINRFLECPPALVDAKWFTPMDRARYFWGNIPGLDGDFPYEKEAEYSANLQNFLTKNVNRMARVGRVRTITTNRNSLLQPDIFPFPVITGNGEGDNLMVTEIEELFGFPRHYTDVGNVTLINRAKLLGRTWSIHVAEHILRSITQYFLSVNDFFYNENICISPASSIRTLNITPGAGMDNILFTYLHRYKSQKDLTKISNCPESTNSSRTSVMNSPPVVDISDSSMSSQLEYPPWVEARKKQNERAAKADRSGMNCLLEAIDIRNIKGAKNNLGSDEEQAGSSTIDSSPEVSTEETSPYPPKKSNNDSKRKRKAARKVEDSKQQAGSSTIDSSSEVPTEEIPRPYTHKKYNNHRDRKRYAARNVEGNEEQARSSSIESSPEVPTEEIPRLYTPKKSNHNSDRKRNAARKAEGKKEQAGSSTINSSSKVPTEEIPRSYTPKKSNNDSDRKRNAARKAEGNEEQAGCSTIYNSPEVPTEEIPRSYTPNKSNNDSERKRKATDPKRRAKSRKKNEKNRKR